MTAGNKAKTNVVSNISISNFRLADWHSEQVHAGQRSKSSYVLTTETTITFYKTISKTQEDLVVLIKLF